MPLKVGSVGKHTNPILVKVPENTSFSGTPKNLLVLVTHRLELLLTLMLGDLLATLFLEVAHFELSLFLYF